MASVWAVVVAAGTGTRFGSPKQYELLGDRRVLDWAVAAARSVADGIVLVVAPDRAGESEPGVDAVVAGAATRSGSVRAGLAAVPGEVEIVVVHDAARPLASPLLFAAVVAAVENGAAGAWKCSTPSRAILVSPFMSSTTRSPSSRWSTPSSWPWPAASTWAS